ncbi:MarR family transcriptional regulator [Pseudovibrio japonicus]|uniref:MarR family transcriptional regulator n=1 Tax=Pseudovibrio japonicus TaxID=366534 RepID=A0ABQ3DV62_9HYPH|nr:MarR family winged helix-turn-helix transcriptional regulator [Pseudovibrio japonicus]GHB17395.1 MarR family transcriptional regulator [Pseudovibrio japonicus]
MNEMPGEQAPESEQSGQHAKPVSAPRTLGEVGLSHFAPYLMNRIMGRYNESLRQKLNKSGLSVAKMRALAVLSVVDGLMINELSVYSVIEQSTLSRTLDAMEKEGLIHRQASEQDNRVRHIFLTEAGRTSFAKMWPHMRDEYSTMFKGVSQAEHDAFLVTLRKMLANIRKHDF